jgi:hypothetical protein
VLGLSRFDHPEIPTSHFENGLSLITDILTQPAMLITETLQFSHMISVIEWLIFIINSFVWGVIAIYGYSKIKNFLGINNAKNT